MKHNVEAFKKYYINATKEEVIEDMFLDNCNLQQEIERLNNIINELEKYIIDFKEDYEKNEFQPNAKVYIYWKDLIDKLQELKGEDEECK